MKSHFTSLDKGEKNFENLLRIKPFAVGNAKSKTMTKHGPAPGIAHHGHHF